MLELVSPTRIARADARPTDLVTMPSCPIHLDSTVRRYRTHGAHGPGVYPQCVPTDGGLPHLLEWEVAEHAPGPHDDPRILTECELIVLEDAAAGLTTSETARKRSKGVETVKTQRRSILLKLGARNITHAIGMTNDTRPAELERLAA